MVKCGIGYGVNVTDGSTLSFKPSSISISMGKGSLMFAVVKIEGCIDVIPGMVISDSEGAGRTGDEPSLPLSSTDKGLSKPE